MDPSGADTWSGHSSPGAVDECIAGRYRLSDLVGTGGMATVWRAEDRVLGRVVAVKVLHRVYAMDPTARRRFRAEARAAASISHPNVVSVFDYGDAGDGNTDEAPFLVMEFVQGRSLAQELAARGSLPAEAVGAVIEQVALGLASAHALQLVHRDIKPGNLLVTSSRTVKITDFGIARAADTVSLTRTGTVVGTAQYISPEQAAGRQAGPASDLYSLGVVAYTCLTGSPPFRAPTPLATAIAHLRNPVPPLPVATPAALEKLVMEMLAKKPEDRPAGALEVASLARAAVAGPARTGKAPIRPGGRGGSEPGPTVELGPPVRTEILPAGAPAGQERSGVWNAAGAKRAALRHPMILVVLVLLAAGLGAIGVAMATGRTRTEKLPNLVGDPAATARATLQHEGLGSTLRSADGPKVGGYVLSQSPGAGTQLGHGQVVGLTVSSGFAQIGDSGYAGQSFGVTAAELAALGVRPTEIYVTGDSNFGQVVTISPSGRVPVGSVVRVEVAAPAPPVPAPPVTGQPGQSGHQGPGSPPGPHHPKPGH